MKLFRSFVIRDSAIKKRALDFIAALPANELWDVEIRPHDPKRSIEQNNLAWLIVTAISEQWFSDQGRQFEKDSWWTQLKREWFGPKILELPDGSFIEREPDSHDKGKKTFAGFLEYLFWRSADVGVVLPDEAHELRRAADERKVA